MMGSTARSIPKSEQRGVLNDADYHDAGQAEASANRRVAGRRRPTRMGPPMQVAVRSDQKNTRPGIVDDGRFRPFAKHLEIDEIFKLDLSELASLEVDDSAAMPIGEIDLRAPIGISGRNVVCVGWNYRLHFDESESSRIRELPSVPTFFTKMRTSIAGPYDDVPLHSAETARLDWEGEMAIVIGKGGANIPQATALDHVFGYAIANDITARDVQHAHGGQWFKGKSLDATSPIGPWVTTADQVPDPHKLTLTCTLNGEIVQRANTSEMVFTVPMIIAELSKGMTLLSGDVVLTGTPAGIGASRTPPRFLGPADILETKIDGLGVLCNHIGL